MRKAGDENSLSFWSVFVGIGLAWPFVAGGAEVEVSGGIIVSGSASDSGSGWSISIN